MRFPKFFGIIFIILVVLAFFYQIAFGKLPIPADTIIGLYHPFRDLYAKEYPNGIPFKNFLITDPIRQQFPWREVAVSLGKKLQFPLWNPYNFGGTPLLGNFQSATLYPFNIFFFLLPFSLAWSILVIFQPFLAGTFLYLYLRKISVSTLVSILGSITFAFSGFSIAWMEWNTIIHTALWLPLLLLSIEQIFSVIGFEKISNIENQKYHREAISRSAGQVKNKKLILWALLFVFSLSSSFFAGHLQTFFYMMLIVCSYIVARWFTNSKRIQALGLFTMCFLLFAVITFMQWYPTFQFISLSARSVDQVGWNKEGWFIPWQHSIQFIAPDFFGNPTTLNYWGVWNYGEFVGYVGILPLIFSLFALFFRRDKKTFFFGLLFFLSIIYSFPTTLAKIPYIFNIPFISTSQPTRLLFLTDFSLAILAALGFDFLIKNPKEIKKIAYPLGFLGGVFFILWFFVMFGKNIVSNISAENIIIAKRNLIFPTVLFIISVGLFVVLSMVQTKQRITIMIRIIIVAITIFDLFRFGWKFTPFTNSEYLFPSTKAIEFLQKNVDNYRIMAADSRILPPNFSTIYRLQSIDGYDPLYILRYGEYIAASERNKPNIDPPFGFNRIITPQNFESPLIDLLGVKYILSLKDLKSAKVKKVFQEGKTQIYQNTSVIPRAFFVKKVYGVNDKKAAIAKMFEKSFDPKDSAVVEGDSTVLGEYFLGDVQIVSYAENRVVIKTTNQGKGFLVLTDTFYPTWRVRVTSEENTNRTKEIKLYRADYNFRGVFLEEGENTVEFYTSLF